MDVKSLFDVIGLAIYGTSLGQRISHLDGLLKR